VSVQAAGKREGWSNYRSVLSDWRAHDPSPPAAGLCRKQASGARSCRIRRENDKTRCAFRPSETIDIPSAIDRPRGTIENQFPARFIQAIVRAAEALLAAKTVRSICGRWPRALRRNVKTPPGALQIAFRPNLSGEVEERSERLGAVTNRHIRL
jgi:hypothetical protein